MQAEGIQLAAEHLRARGRRHGLAVLAAQRCMAGRVVVQRRLFRPLEGLQFHARRFYAPQLIAALAQ
jgi:beta-mannosidase